MKIIRVFPRRTSHTPTDELAFVGDPPLDRLEADEVHVSCTFTWDKEKAERLKLAWGQYYPIVKLGGPAYDDPGDGFTPGMYLKEGITICSRGCNNHCPWCDAWRREGKWRPLPICPGDILQDNNVLQGSQSFIDSVFDMLRTRKQVYLTGGIEADRVTQDLADRIRSLNLREIFLACDTDEAIKPLRKALKLLQIPANHHKARCYVLLKYDPNETMLHALIRLLSVWEAGAVPSAQLYQPAERWIKYPQEWRELQRVWERPAAANTYVKNLFRHLKEPKQVKR